MSSIIIHEQLQTFLEKLYLPLANKVKKSLFAEDNEIYGEIHYYSLVKLLDKLKLTATDHFLDLGSGIGKLAFQVFLTTNVAAVTGIEINKSRDEIAQQINKTLKESLPQVFKEKRSLSFVQGDFLEADFFDISVIYVCSAVFSHELLAEIGEKINKMPNVHTLVSVRKIPNLKQLSLTKKMHLHSSWDIVSFHIYKRTD